MKIIADSGGSKTEWRLLTDSDEILQYSTLGLNPFHLSDGAIVRELKEDLLPKMKENGVTAEKVDQVYFYGAGIDQGRSADRMSAQLRTVFTSASVEVASDMLAATRGLCADQPGIACILGTGANSAFYNGSCIENKIEAVGFILGDEGSGAWIGKIILADYLREKLPEELRRKLENRFGLSRQEILEKVYNQSGAARYLAGFSKFVFQNIKDPYLHRLVRTGFELFFQENVLRYPQVREVPVHFSGSVAFYYANILRQIAADHGVHVQHIVEGPIAGLTLYHQKE